MPFGADSVVETRGGNIPWKCPACQGRNRAHTYDSDCKYGEDAPDHGEDVQGDGEARLALTRSPNDNLSPRMLDHMSKIPTVFATLANIDSWKKACKSYGDGPDPDDDMVPPIFREIQRQSGLEIVPMKEVKNAYGSDREEWRQALENELNSFYTSGTFREATPTERREVYPSDILPMQVVAGRKPPDETGYKRKKARGVVCGNFEEDQGNEVTFTANLDASSFRAALATAAHNDWSIAVMDVSTAFLNADLPIGHKKVIVRPPAIFVHYGLVPAGTLWVAEKAVYGLRVSPKAWADKRDDDMSNVTVYIDNHTYRLVQSDADPAVWNIVGETEWLIQGYVLTYVDDFMIIGSDATVEGVRTALRSLWTTSDQPTISRTSPGKVKYLSIDVEYRSDGSITLSQHAYTRELLEKWGMKDCKGNRAINLGKEEFLEFDDYLPDDAEGTGEKAEPELKDVRMAQRMAGGLLWLSSRTRPDISFGVSRVAALATKNPTLSLIIGKKILRYLAFSSRYGLVYPKGAGSDPEYHDDDKKILAAKLDTYADASVDDVSTQTGVAQYLWECMVDWRSIRQQAIAGSTAEAEVNALATGELVNSSLKATLETMGIAVRSTLFGDNQAANQISTGRGTWKTRALSQKVNGIKSRTSRGLLRLEYIETALMRADGLTKHGGPQHAERVRGHFGLQEVL